MMKRFLTGLLSLILLAVPARAAENGFKPLFNGKNLEGWKVFPRGTGGWKVEDGVLVSGGDKASHLFTDRGDFTDFHVRAEVMINEGGNSGLYFRTQFGPGFPKGYEAQINSTHRDPIKTGSLYGFPKEAEKTVIKKILVKPDEWFTYEVLCKGNHITIKVNGETTVNNFEDKEKRFAKGHFALQHHHKGNRVKVRKFEVREFSTEKE